MSQSENARRQTRSSEPLGLPATGAGSPVRQRHLDELDDELAERERDELVAERVEVGLELLRALREVPDEVERYVSVYSEASFRRNPCSELVDMLQSPEPDWQSVHKTFEKIRPLSRLKDVRALPDEITALALEFDEKRAKASGEILLALNTAQAADRGRIKDTVFKLAWDMRERAGEVAEACHDGAQGLFDGIRKSVQALFGVVDTQLEHRRAVQREARAGAGRRDLLNVAPSEPAAATVSARRRSAPNDEGALAGAPGRTGTSRQAGDWDRSRGGA